MRHRRLQPLPLIPRRADSEKSVSVVSHSLSALPTARYRQGCVSTAFRPWRPTDGALVMVCVRVIDRSFCKYGPQSRRKLGPQTCDRKVGMTDPPHFVIVGGGTAGWIAASFSRTGPALKARCTHLGGRSSKIPTVGVGEATTARSASSCSLQDRRVAFFRETGPPSSSASVTRTGAARATPIMARSTIRIRWWRRRPGRRRTI